MVLAVVFGFWEKLMAECVHLAVWSTMIGCMELVPL